MSFFAHPEYTLGVQVEGTVHSYRIREFADGVFIFGQGAADRAFWDAELSELTIDENGRVEQWNDATIGSRHLLQPDPAKRGVVVPHAMNGRDVVRFNGIEEFMQFAGSLFAPGEFGSIYIVGRYWSPTSAAADEYIFNMESSSGQIAYHKATPDEDFKQAMHYDDGNGGAFDAAYYEKSNDNPWLFTMYMQGAGNPVVHGFGTDRIGGFTTGGFSDRATGDDTITVGAASAAAGFAHVDIASILIVGGTSTPAQRDFNESFLQQRFGLTTPAVVLATPEDITAIFGGELEAAYEPDPATMTLSGSEVLQWDDLSANGHNLNPQTLERRPTWAPAAGPNQAGEVQYSSVGVQVDMMLETLGMAFAQGDRPSVLVVGRFADADAGAFDQVMINVRDLDNLVSLLRVYQDDADDMLTLRYSADDGGGGMTAEVLKIDADLADHHLIEMHLFASGSQGGVDGGLAPFGSTAALSIEATGNDRLFTATENNQEDPLNGAITELVILNAEPTADQMERYRRRVALLYGLADAGKGV